MKIKKFKVSLRKKEIFRNLKLTTEIKEITPQLDEAVLKEIEKSNNYLSPAGVTETFPLSEALSKFELAPQDFEQKPVPISVSVIVVTIGNTIEKEIELARQSGKPLHSEIIHSLGLEACNSSLNFIYRIINEESAEEECTLLPLEKLSGDIEKSVTKKMDTQRIGVSIDENNQIHPVYSCAAIIRWINKVKK
ncbi:MAG: hypothetical protein KKH91_05335 [Elusimicrobia bacterium]|nr:hypothetical protein [Elusimicrobiota bacterium]